MIFQDPARRTVPITGLIASLILLLQVTVLAADEPSADQVARLEFFEKKIRPVLVLHCYECHSVLSKEPKGELLLDSRPGMQKGGRVRSGSGTWQPGEESPCFCHEA